MQSEMLEKNRHWEEKENEEEVKKNEMKCSEVQIELKEEGVML